MAEIYMDVDTALSEVPVNSMPLIDDTDFKTIEASVAYNAAGLALRWNFVTTGGAYTQTAVTPTTSGDYDWSSQGSGMYSIEIPASGGASINNNLPGFGWFTGVATGVLPWRGPVICFRAAGTNDKLIDGSYSTTRGLAGTDLDAAVTSRMATYTQPTGFLAATFDSGTVASTTNITSGTITTVGTATNLTNLPTAPANWLTATAIENGAFTAAKFASGAFDAVWSVATRLLTAGTNIVLAKGTGITGLNDLTAAQVNAEVDQALADYDGPTNSEMEARTIPSADYATSTAQGTAQTVLDKLDDTLEDNSGTFRFTAAALAEAPTGGSAPTEAEIYTYFTSESRQNTFRADTSLLALEATSQAILDDTSELQTDWANGGRLDVILDARASQASVDDVPTVAEFEARTIVAADYALEATSQAILTDTAEIGAAGAGLTSLASQASVNDLPTNAEFEARTLPAADYFDASTDEVTPTAASKTGYKLASDGLDAITMPEHTGPASSLLGKIAALYARFFNRVVRTPTTIATYRDDGTTVATTQTYTSADPDNDDVGAAT
jgi:hypothetical protein